MKTLLIVPVLAALLLLSPFATAQESSPGKEHSVQDIEKAKAKFQEAEVFFETGEFAEAGKLYKDAYVLSKRPVLLKNMALCEWKQENFGEAIHLYEAYLHTESDVSLHPEVEGYIEQLKLEQQEYEKKQKEQQELISSMSSSLPTPVQKKKFRIWYLPVGAAILGGLATAVVVANNRVDPNLFDRVEIGNIPPSK